MTCPLTGLPDELQIWIIENIQNSGKDGFNTLLNLSSTCYRYRSLLAPIVFHTINLKNTARSAESVLAVANNDSLKHHVKHLDFVGTLAQIDFIADPCGGNEELYCLLEDSKDAKWVYMDDLDAEEVFPTVVSDILSDLRLFPQLTMLTVRFDSDSWWGYARSNFSMLDDLEHINENTRVELLEQKEPYKALMSRTFVALSRNTNHSITALHLRLIPVVLAAYSSLGWFEFLKPIEKCTFTIKGQFNARIHIRGNYNCCPQGSFCEDCGEPPSTSATYGYPVGDTIGYRYFVSKLSQLFFDHLDSVTDLRIIAPDSGPLWHDTLCSLAKHQMPKLRSLYLERVYVCHQLGHFLAAHRDFLEDIVFQDCYGNDTGGCSWGRLLDHLSDAGPTRLQRLEIRPFEEPVFLKSRDSSLPRPGSRIDALDLDVAESLLANDPHLPAFSYAWFDEDGIIEIADYDYAVASIHGDDLKSYYRLLAIVEANRATRSQV
ncbi:hypothetical protein BU16DRAFT_287747 [Lophium mytilinum]|uniref:F-box domain-containing protein n=1 Tax=Lophium mytilinum TaxID=390894 RepID=A0A6A6R0E1_9PEZI|nr:hypothetical protein BU16DRAFT_287747 [Lophium mytilinum]